MKQIITYLVVTVLGLLSPSMSTWAQNFSGVFKQITSPEEFTEGYYVIARSDSKELLMGSNNEKKPRGKTEIAPLLFSQDEKEVKNPTKNLVWKVEKMSNGEFTLRNMKSNNYLAPSQTKSKDNELRETDKDNYSFIFKTYKNQGITLEYQTHNHFLLFNKNSHLNVFVFCKEKNNTFIPRFYKLVEQATIPFTISAAKYATYYGEKAVKLPAGLKAHIGKVDASKHIVQLTAISDVVPAKTAVIITGEAGSYSLAVSTETVAAISGNDLKGSSTEIPFVNFQTTQDYYALAQSPENKVCFGLLKTDLPAGKAYFTLPKAAGSAPQFLGEFLVSSVQQVQRNTTEGAIYDLNGKKVAHPVSGNVYVRNGKKFIFLR